MTLVERYLELGLRLGRHIEGLVDAYHGPAGLAERVEAEGPVDPALLAANATALVAELDDTELAPQRRRWLRGQLGIRPLWTPEETFERTHRALDEVLPGEGSLAERYAGWQDARTIPGDRLAGLLDDVVRDSRARTERVLDLPEGEGIELELVHDEP